MINKVRENTLSSRAKGTFIPKYSFVLATLGVKREGLTSVIKSISDQTFTSLELVVVHQCTRGDAPIPPLTIFQYPHKYICIEKKSLSLARNIGILAATGEFILFAEDDAEYPSDFLQRLDMVIGGERVVYHCSYVDKASRETSFPISAVAKSSANFILNHGSSLCLVISKRILMEMDGFDTRLGLGEISICKASEEMDLMLKCVAAGCQLKVLSDMIIYHPIGHRLKLSNFMERARSSAGADFYLRYKYQGLLAALLWLGNSLARAFATLLILRLKSAAIHFRRFKYAILYFPRLIKTTSCGIGALLPEL